MASVEYEIAGDDVINLIAKVMDEYHATLKRYDVKVLTLMAFAPRDEEDNIKRPAIRKNGVACAACIRVLSLKERLLKQCDAEMTIDGDTWEDLDEPKRIAVIDHELSHLDTVLDKNGEVKKDSLRRPKLRLIHDNIVYWGNSEIAERHGANSLEYINAQNLKLKFGKVLGLGQKKEE